MVKSADMLYSLLVAVCPHNCSIGERVVQPHSRPLVLKEHLVGEERRRKEDRIEERKRAQRRG
jgi:hypothetical protein